MTNEARLTPGEDGPSFGLGSLPNILWQRRWLVLAPFVLISLAAIAAAFLLPRTYQSSATLLVESPDLMAAAPGPTDSPIDRRMAKIRQQILSRPDLVDLIQTNDLYDASRHGQPLSELVDRMRGATKIAAVDADIQRTPAAGAKGSIAFSLSFDYPQAAQAQIVAQTFVNRLLKLDATSTQAEAQTNVAFLEDQQSGLQSQVDAIEGQVNRIAGVNGAALSSANLALMTSGGATDYATQIAALQRENAQLAAQSGVAVERDPQVTAAEAALAAARAQYSDDHPDVRLAQSRLAAVRANARTSQASGVSPVVRQQIAANNNAIGDLQRQRGSEQGRAAALASAQARGPAIAQQVQQLQSRADMLQTNLAKVQSNLLTARSMVRLADQQRGERLTLIDPPVTPDRPTSPNRPLLIVGGILGGLLAGLALALLAELIFRPIRSVSQITSLLGEAPLAVVPVMNRKPLRRRGLRLGRRVPADAA